MKGEPAWLTIWSYLPSFLDEGIEVKRGEMTFWRSHGNIVPE